MVRSLNRFKLLSPGVQLPCHNKDVESSPSRSHDVNKCKQEVAIKARMDGPAVKGRHSPNNQIVSCLVVKVYLE